MEGVVTGASSTGEDGSRKEECNSRDRRIAAGCTLNGTRDSKTGIPVEPWRPARAQASGNNTKESAMTTRMNIIDCIMIPALLLASIYILINSYLVGESSIDNPITAQWALSLVGSAYVLYQAVRIRSPLLTFTSGAVVLTGCFGPVIVHMSYYWRNTIWEPLGRGFAAVAVSVIILAVVGLPVVGVACVAWIARRKWKSTITESALQMLREHNKVDAAKLAQRFGISEIDARAYIAESRRRGAFPFKADIV